MRHKDSTESGGASSGFSWGRKRSGAEKNPSLDDPNDAFRANIDQYHAPQVARNTAANF